MKSYKNIITIFLFIVAIIFIIYGIHNKEFVDVMKKANKICFDCIGIG